MSLSALPRVAVPSARLLRYLKHQSEQFSNPIAFSSCISCPGRARFASTSCGEVKLLPAPRVHTRGLYDDLRTAPNPPLDTRWSNGPHYSSSSFYGSPSSNRRRSSLGEGNKPSLRRLFSSGRFSSLWNILGLGLKARTGTRTLDLPPLASFLDDGQSPGRILKPTNEPRLRCTEFDEQGNVTVVNGEFKKTELIAKVCNLTTLTYEALV